MKDHSGTEIGVKSTKHDFARHSLQFTTGAANATATVFFTNDRKSQPVYGDAFELFEMKAGEPASQ